MQEHIFTVSELNQLTRGLLESHFSRIWVEGEISNFVCPSSGHWYFSLKDKSAQVRCAMFRGHNNHITFKPENGMYIIVFARPSLYEGRGDFQLIVEKIEEVGFGRLQRAFEELKQKLAKEGLFDQANKKPLPKFPQQIGVVTSPTGAAIRDILSVLKRRFPLPPIIVYPSLVQGDTAAKQIAATIKIANQRKECDVLIVARGGGSIEDLWSFNEEIVARAIFASQIPIISGIGHEIDFTIADFVADHRAPTPSAAAEFVSPNKQEILQQLQKTKQRLHYSINKFYEHQHIVLKSLTSQLKRFHPIQQLQDKTQQLDLIEQNLIAAQHKILETRQTKFQLLSQALNTISPLATLQRGYAIVTNKQNTIVRNTAEVKVGEKLNTKLATGKLQCTVEQIYEK
jgi:exodeoxyribonuclease VII large subunit